jgi:hypothetical protein
MKFRKNAYANSLDVKQKSGGVERVNYRLKFGKKKPEWTFKHNTTEEIESITLDQIIFFPDNNEANNVGHC